MTRLYRVLNSLSKILGEFKPIVRIFEHYVDEDAGIEYINMRISFSKLNAVLTIREYWYREALIAYGYYIRVKDYEEWWDNRPHHPEIQTFPHHRHIEGRIEPLTNPSLEHFLQRVRELLGRKK